MPIINELYKRYELLDEPSSQLPDASPKRKPVNSRQEYVEQHCRLQSRIDAYLRMPRRISATLPRNVSEEMKPRAAMLLAANNITARLAFTTIFARRIVELQSSLDDETTYGWITLSPVEFVVADNEAAKFQVKTLQKWAQNAMSGTDFVGMVEGALYTDCAGLGPRSKRAVSWHAHLIAWGAGEAELRKRIGSVNRLHSPLIPEADAAHVRMLRADKVLGQVFYMLKAPLSDYRAFPKRTKKAETEEMTNALDGSYLQRKREIRTGDAVQMCAVFANRYLDRLAFSGGDGDAVLGLIRREALRPYRSSPVFMRERARRQRSA